MNNKARLWDEDNKVFSHIDLLDLQGAIQSLDSFRDYFGATYFRLHPEYWMYAIGLQDKNKRDIYEGDIGEIRTQSGRIDRFVVEWGIHRREMKSGWTVDIPSFCFRIDGFPSFPIVNNYMNGHDLDIIEIIGNIYQNPKLVKS